MTTAAILEQEFLPLRAKLLEIAATLDRFDRADGSLDSEPRLEQVRAAIEVLRGSGDRTEQIQLLFSREYEARWRESLGMARDR